MVKLTIDNTPVVCDESLTIMDAAASAGIPIPHLCYLKDINEIAACRVCVVEVEGTERLVPACDNTVQEGMVVYTNSPRVREARRVNVELLMSQHSGQCMSCVRSGNCSLQTVANDLNILDDNPYPRDLPINRWDKNAPLFKDVAKCIKCMRCVNICDKVQDMRIWDVEGTGGHTNVNVSMNREIMNADCAFCGQCITHCPTGALRERDDTMKVIRALADPKIVTVVQVAPAVRNAWGEEFGMTRQEASELRMVAALKKLGFDYVFDTDFAADMTIMEEATEFLEQITHPDQHKFPMFTSCCPGWVRFLKSQFPDMVGQLSTTKSPHQMFGATIKSYFAETQGIDPKNIRVISIMPCVAKKAECAIPNQNDACGDPDVDIVLTTREMNRMLRSDHIIPQILKDVPFDEPLGIASGAGVIFGITGGVMEAALRTAYFAVTGKNPAPDAFKDVRGMDGWKESTFEINGTKLRIAVVSGLGNTRKLITALRKKEVAYDFVEVMACPGGCSGGGGMPIHDGFNLTEERGEELYNLDLHNKIRFSHENPGVTKIYADYFEKPLSEKAEHLLHTDHFGWEMPLSPYPNRETQD
ncbi:MAG: [FeFe] hydrogenase, group A [Lachnospiraceae bacterium]|nr:[FeFe] hydrogenase, group A [Lachnospiraceae bacterium]